MKKEVLLILWDIILEKYKIEKDDLKLSIPPKGTFWDFSFNWGVLARDLRKNPNIIVEEIKEFLDIEIKNKKWFIIESSEISGAYLNIKINNNIFTEQLLKFIEDDEFEELREKNSEETILIDYIWANVWKPMHIGHMCTPNQGQAMINIYKKLWFDVISDSHIWDWGIIFGKLILAYKKWWNEDKLKENAVEHLLELYIKITEEAEKDIDFEDSIRKEFQKLSKGDLESVKLWESFTKESIIAMNKQLGRLNVKPDFNIGESFYEWLNLPKIENYPNLKFSMKEIVKELIENNIATKNDDNSVWIEFSKESKITSCILQKRDWTHWYLASDLASIKYRVENWNPVKIIYFVDSRQQLHLRQTFEVARKANWVENIELFHAYNWFISLKDWAMSTRKGRIIKLDKLLDEAELRAEKIILEKRDDIKWSELKELSKIIWIWAIKYWYLKKNRESDVIFDWDEFMSFEGNSGPYIQYAYVRSIRILEKANFKFSDSIEKQKISLIENEEIELIKKILEYKNILIESTKNNYPHILAWYSYELTKTFNNFYNNVHIISEKNEYLRKLKLNLVKEFGIILKESFELLWIEMPEKM